MHRDVKPSNILITADGTAKLADFGIARARDSTVTSSGAVTGSPAYLAPEVASGRPATEASDVWSLGATLYQALTGRPPYDTSDSVLAAMYRIVHEHPPRLPGAGWPAGLLDVTMAADPADRWPMTRVRQYLAAGPPPPVAEPAPTLVQPPDDAVSDELSDAASPVAPAEVGAPPVVAEEDRRGWLLPVLIALAVVLVAVVTWAVLRASSTPSATDEPTTSSSSHPSSSASHAPTRRPSASSPRTSAAPSTQTTPTQSATAQNTPTQSPSTEASPTAVPGPGGTRAAMRSFVQQYIATALADPSSAWQELSPRFQQDCCDGSLGNYAGYWNTIDNATLRDVVADPAAMQVSYIITWDPAGRPPEDENVTLGLVRQDGRYLIDYEL